jgi:hypothetical protein
MAKIVGELLFGLIRILIEDWLKQTAVKVCAWLDTRVHARTTRIVLGTRHRGLFRLPAVPRTVWILKKEVS